MLIVFILFRWYIIDLIWEGRFIPPEPDDSFVYITHIRMIGDTGNFFYNFKYIFPWYHADHLAYIIWSFMLSTVKLISNSSYVDVYKVNFYFGIFMLSCTILYMLKVLERDKLYWISAFSFLTLYIGSGEYHGFYWVVPSFYSLVASLLLISLVFKNNGHDRSLSIKWVGILFLITFLTIWSHPLGKFSYAAILLSFIIYIIINKLFHIADFEITLLSRAKAFIISGLISILSLEVLPSLIGVVPSRYYNLQGIVAEISAEHSAFDQFVKLYLDYFNIESYGLVLLIIGLFALLYNRKVSILSLYLGFFTVSLIASFFNKLGYRMLIYLWPITFLIYSYGFYFLMRKLFDKYIDKSDKNFGLTIKIHNSNIRVPLNKDFILMALIFLLVSINYVYPFMWENYEWNLHFAEYQGNRMAEWSIDNSIIEYLLNVTNPGDLLIYTDSNAFFAVTSLGLLDRKVAYSDWDWSKDYVYLLGGVNGSYLVTTGNPKIDVLKVSEAFRGRLSFSFVNNFGLLNIYQATIKQMETSYPITYDELNAELITDDSQKNFWSKTKNVHLYDDSEIFVSGNNSLRILLSQSDAGDNDHIWRTYDTPQDFSDKDFLIFYWYGAGSEKKIEILIYAPDGMNRFDYTFKDENIGWNRMIVPLNQFSISVGNPLWGAVKTIYIRFHLDAPYTDSFNLDRLVFDVKQRQKEHDLILISYDIPTVNIFLSFLATFFLPGLMWSIFVFKIQDRIGLVPISFGVSLSLIFLTSFWLNLRFGLEITRDFIIFLTAIITALPIVIYIYNSRVKDFISFEG